jgi:hypothetical protein
MIVRRHLPHSVPAAQASPTSSTVRAPAATTASIWTRVTTRHRQTYTPGQVNAGAGQAGETPMRWARCSRW